MPEYQVCTTADVDPGAVAGFELATDSRRIPLAVIHSNAGRWYAIADRCPHGRVKLSDGFVEGESIECARHGATFDLASGAVQSPPASSPVKTYPVRIDGESVMVTVRS